MVHTLPLAAMEKLLKNAGAPRVSENAKKELRDVLEEYAEVIGKYAVKIALHSKRKTIKGEDIKISLKSE
ncbi:histone family protein [Candidatus Woesearchaeota archaeon]|nr:histone family protein [Candidatus Woesearchaeota archaeon]